MALPDPRTLPDCLLRPAKCTFDLEPMGALSRSAGGEVSFQEKVGGQLWQMSLTSRPLKESDYSIAHAFRLSLPGKSFVAYDLRRPYPFAYGRDYTALASGTFDGTCTVAAFTGGGTLALSGLPASYKLTAGDYLSFTWLGARRLVKALETVTASGGGAIAGVAISPWQIAGSAASPTATLVRAWTLMRMVPGSWSGDRTILDPVSFQAIESPA